MEVPRIAINTAAEEWADNAVGAARVQEADKPYVRATLVAAATIKEPMDPLRVAITPNGPSYTITIAGYRGLLDDLIWVTTFLGRNRDDYLLHVTNTFTQDTKDGVTKVLHVQKVEFMDAPAPRSAGPVKRLKRRG